MQPESTAGLPVQTLGVLDQDGKDQIHHDHPHRRREQ